MYSPAPSATSSLDVGPAGSEPTEAVREAFDAADANRNGTLDQRELGAALKRLDMPTTPQEVRWRSFRPLRMPSEFRTPFHHIWTFVRATA